MEYSLGSKLRRVFSQMSKDGLSKRIVIVRLV
jgi:hypothetical protein